MAGFRNLRQYADAPDNGQYHITSFRKVMPSTATPSNPVWIDLGYAGGSPQANFYASTPLEAALVPQSRGFNVPNVAPYKQVLKNMKIMSSTRTNTTDQADRQQMMLVDYLLYYPFIDMDNTGVDQEFVNDVPLPSRYPNGGKLILVSQSSFPQGGVCTINYTNQDGVAGRVTPSITTGLCTSGGQLAPFVSNAGGSIPFAPLQGNDTEVQSVQSVNFSVAGGGLLAAVIVKPLFLFPLTKTSRRDAATNISAGSCDEFRGMMDYANLPVIEDDAVLGILSCARNVSSLDSIVVTGIIETVWN